MRIKRTIATSASMAMLAFTLLACESDEKKQPKAETAVAEQAEDTGQAKAQEPPKAQEQVNNEDGVFIFNREIFLKRQNEETNRRDPSGLIELATGEKPCENISNPVKKQDCVDNINTNDVLAKIQKEQIGKTMTYSTSSRVLPKPESRFLCEFVNAGNIFTDVLTKEHVDKFKEMNDNGKNQSYGIERCVTLVEDKYILELDHFINGHSSSIAIFNSKEDAMNFDEDIGAVSLKLKRKIFAYGFRSLPNNGVYRYPVNVYEYNNKGSNRATLLAEEKKIWSTEAVNGEYTFAEAEKLCSSRSERLPNLEDLNIFNALADKELSANFEKGAAAQEWWWYTPNEYHYICEAKNGICHMGYGYQRNTNNKRVHCIRKR
jgi:hypothetical protein